MAMRRLQNEKAAGRVLVVRNVPYVHRSEARNVHKQQSDIYLPAGNRCNCPLIVHFHGGGWKGGDKGHEWFGSPAVARSHAAAGCVVVTPSYRLGDSPAALMEDARMAVLWAVANATSLGADPDRLYLSGHSAGGNIAALLAVGPWLAPPILPAGAVKGVMGISGVYTLLRPLGGAFSCYKNRIFDRYMRIPVFGDEIASLTQYSPTALVRLGGGLTEPFKPRWSDYISKSARHALSAVALSEPLKAQGTPKGVTWALELPPFLLVNGSWDLGLEDDAEYFAKTLAKRTGIMPEHHVIPNTNHATVSWDEQTFKRCREFILACEARRGSGESILYS